MHREAKGKAASIGFCMKKGRRGVIVEACVEDYETLAGVWERSVRATHHFLTEQDILHFRERIMDCYFPQVELWKYVEDGKVCGFIGLSDTIEMLFVDPDCFRRGIGSRLLAFAVTEKGMTRVDVNEQNPGAMAFYRAHGFEPVSRSETDSEGNHFPIIYHSLLGG